MRKWKFAIAALASWVLLTASGVAQVKNYRVPGSLESQHPLACVDLSEVSDQYTPADIFPGVAKCISAETYDKGLSLYMVAMAFGKFDSMRVSDSTAGQAFIALSRSSMNGVDREKQDAFLAKLESDAKPGSATLAILCASVRPIGPPKYVPTYMIKHGMNAVFGTDGDGLVEKFDAESGWQKVLTGFLKCP